MSRRGYTLIELIVAMGLASLVIVGMNSLLLPLVRAQANAARTQSAQGGLAGALGAVEKSLRGATAVTNPSLPGFPSDRLEGCWNAVASGTGFAALDPSRPVGWFAVCVSGGALYYHRGDGCPARYSCGRDALAEFGGGRSRSAEAAFLRVGRGSPVVEASLSLTSGDATARATTAVAVEEASGEAR